jgi:murein L,D-transpeptidase YafK
MGLLLVLSFFSGASPQRASREQAAVTTELPNRSPVAAPRVVLIRKADRVLGMYRNGRLAGTYPIALGSYPEGHKQREGDGRTPEGEYYVCTRNPHSSFHLFLGLSYPNAKDAVAGRRAGAITEQQHRAITSAIAARRQPPWDTLGRP